MSASKPTWMRLDTSFTSNPKIQQAIGTGGRDAALLWIEGLAYATSQLTDGWVPPKMPTRWGYKPRHITALTSAGLWFEVPITDHDGWLINDYEEYQPTRADWEKVSEMKRIAARARWAERT